MSSKPLLKFIRYWPCLFSRFTTPSDQKFERLEKQKKVPDSFRQWNMLQSFIDLFFIIFIKEKLPINFFKICLYVCQEYLISFSRILHITINVYCRKKSIYTNPIVIIF